MKLHFFWFLPLLFLTQNGAYAVLGGWPEFEDLTKTYSPIPARAPRDDEYLKNLKSYSKILPCNLGDTEDFCFSPRRYFMRFEGERYLEATLRAKKEDYEYLVKLHFYTSCIAEAVSYPEASRKQMVLAELSLVKLLDDSRTSFKETVPLSFQYWTWKKREHFPTVRLDWGSIFKSALDNYHLPAVYRQLLDEEVQPPEKRKKLQQPDDWQGYKKGQLYTEYLRLRDEYGYGSPEARLFCEKLADLEQHAPHYRLGLQAEENGKLEEALAHYEKAYVYPPVHKRIALIKLSQDQEKADEEALFHLRLAVHQDPSVWGILTRMAYEKRQSLEDRFDRFLEKYQETFPALKEDVACIKALQDNGERFKQFEKKAREGSPFHAYELAEMYVQQRGETPEDWLKELEEATRWYRFSEKCGVEDARGKSQTVQEERIASLQKAKGYILNKLIHLSKILPVGSFDPNHPLFKESSCFMDALYPYSPTVIDLGTYLLMEVLRADSQEEKKKETITQLLDLVKSRDFQEKLKKFPEKEQVSSLLENLIEEGRKKAVTTEFSEFLKTLEAEKQKGESYILAKVKEGVGEQIFSSGHPLYKGIIGAISELQTCPPNIKEASIYLFQQLLKFPRQSKQAQVILDHIGRWIFSEDFKNEADPGDPDAQNLAEEEFKKIAEQIHITLDQKKLCLPSEIPENLKVKEAMVSDPRISLYNYFFEEDQKPFDQKTFEDSADGSGVFV